MNTIQRIVTRLTLVLVVAITGVTTAVVVDAGMPTAGDRLCC
jgi:hypothetical protein